MAARPSIAPTLSEDPVPHPRIQLATQGLALPRFFFNLWHVLIFLRFIGVMNAAIWLGSVIFFAVVVNPAFLSDEMARILPKSHSGAAAQIVWSRFYVLQGWCGAIAVGHLVMEWLYAGKPLGRWTLYLAATLLGLALIGGFALQPRLKKLHLDIYGMRSTPQQRQYAVKSFRNFYAVAQFTNFLIAVGLFAYVWEMSTPGSAPRFLPSSKFRG